MSIKSVSYDTLLVIMAISKATKTLRLDLLFQLYSSHDNDIKPI
jgi:hypothetical protein